MSKEHFKIIKEISSLHTEMTSLSNSIKSQSDRLTKHHQKIDETKLEIQRLQEVIEQESPELSKKEAYIDKLSTNLKKAKDHQADLTTEIQVLKSKQQVEEMSQILNDEEEVYFSLIEIHERSQSLKDEKTTYLEGLNRSLVEISDDSKKEEEKLQLSYNTQKSRIKLLLNQIPSGFQKVIKATLNKKLNKSSFTIIKDFHCLFCGYQINKVDLDKLEQMINVITCSSCTRIIIPQASNF